MPIFDFTVRAEDNNGNFADRAFRIEVLNTLRERVILNINNNVVDKPFATLTGPDTSGYTEFNVNTLPANYTDTSPAFQSDTEFRQFYSRNEFFVTVDGINSIYSSPDGRIWTDRTADWTGAGANIFSTRRAKDNFLYTVDPVAENILRSVDNGATWTVFSAVPGTIGGGGAYIANTWRAPSGIMLEFNPQTGTYMCVIPQNSAPNATHEFYRSTDNGVSWTLIRTEVMAQADYINTQPHSELVLEGGAFIFTVQKRQVRSLLLYSFDDGQTFNDGAAVANLEIVNTGGRLWAPMYINGRWFLAMGPSSPNNTETTTRGIYTSDFITWTPSVLGTSQTPVPTTTAGGSFRFSKPYRSQGRLFSLVTENATAAAKQLYFTEDAVTWNTTGVVISRDNVVSDAPAHFTISGTNTPWDTGYNYFITADDL